MRKTKEERVAIVQSGGDEALDKYGGRVGVKGGMIDASYVKVSMPGNVIDIGLKGQGAIQDNIED